MKDKRRLISDMLALTMVVSGVSLIAIALKTRKDAKDLDKQEKQLEQEIESLQKENESLLEIIEEKEIYN